MTNGAKNKALGGPEKARTNSQRPPTEGNKEGDGFEMR